MKIKGMIIRVSEVKPLISIASYICEDCGSEVFQTVNSKYYLPLTECPSTVCR